MDKSFEYYVSDTIDEHLQNNLDYQEITQTQNLSILKALAQGIKDCKHQYEEEGGLILEKAGEHLFVCLSNKYKHTPTAFTLYEPDLEEFKNGVASRVADGWKLAASFHTHPRFYCDPSRIDIEKLFKGFMINYIYSHHDKLVSISVWRGDKVFTVKMHPPSDQFIANIERGITLNMERIKGAQSQQGAQGAQGTQTAV